MSAKSAFVEIAMLDFVDTLMMRYRQVPNISPRYAATERDDITWCVKDLMLGESGLNLTSSQAEDMMMHLLCGYRANEAYSMAHRRSVASHA